MMPKSRIFMLLTLALGLSSISGAQDKSSWHWSFESNDVWYTDRDDYGVSIR